MLEINEEIIDKAKQAKTVEELITLAKQHDFQLTEEEAAEYFEALNQKTGELSDEELDNVAGGGCRDTSGLLKVTPFYKCGLWQDKLGFRPREMGAGCIDCKHVFSYKIVYYCTHPDNIKR